MPSIRLTDANVRNLKLQKSTWYSGDRRHAFPGLRLCVSQTCKTFYLAKRDPHTRKTVSVKLGRFPDLSVQAAWKKAEAEGARIHNGTVRDAMPTVRELLERY